MPFSRTTEMKPRTSQTFLLMATVVVAFCVGTKVSFASTPKCNYGPSNNCPCPLTDTEKQLGYTAVATPKDDVTSSTDLGCQDCDGDGYGTVIEIDRIYHVCQIYDQKNKPTGSSSGCDEVRVIPSVPCTVGKPVTGIVRTV